MAGIETEPKEPAPSLARIFDQLAEKATEVSSSGPSSSFVSCLRINGRPLLGPLMTPERRLQCQTWKMQAIGRETMLKKKQVRREKTISCVKSPEESTGEEDCEYEEDFDSSTSSSSSSSDSEDEDDGESVVIMPRSRTAAFKSLIHRLRHDHHESTQSINTVIENPDFSPSHSVTSTSSPPPPMRERSGSYTLDEPSPLLRAYMQRFGNVDMSQSPKTTMMGPPITRKVLPSPGELNDSRGKAEHLQQYLAHLSTMPERLSVGSKPPKCSSPPKKTTNPPTPKEDRSEKSGFLSAKDENDLVSVPRLELEENPSVASSAMNSMSLNIETPASAQYPSLPSEKIDSARSLVSEMTSLTIEAPSSSEPPTMIETTTSQRTYTNCPSDAPTPMIASPSVTLNLPSTLNTARSESTSATTTNREIEEAVSCLAQEQQRRVQRLMEQQSKQREELKRMFEEQQKKLIGEIMSTVKPPASVLQPILNPSPSELPSWALRSPRPLSPVVPAMQSHVRPISTLPLDYKFPTEVENRENHLKLCKLSALAKGYLTRRLMKTTKVQDITSSIRETMNTALKLHQVTVLAYSLLVYIFIYHSFSMTLFLYVGSQIGRPPSVLPRLRPSCSSSCPTEQRLPNLPRHIFSTWNSGKNVHHCPRPRDSIKTCFQSWTRSEKSFCGDQSKA